jgi:hypothetical protein
MKNAGNDDNVTQNKNTTMKINAANYRIAFNHCQKTILEAYN